MMVAILFASTTKVYGQGWVPGGERSFHINGSPTWIDIKPNGDFRFWDGSNQTRDVVYGDVSSLNLLQRPFEYTLSNGDVFRMNALFANSLVGLFNSDGSIKWQYNGTATFMCEGDEGNLYIYSAPTQSVAIVNVVDGSTKSTIGGPIKWLQSNVRGGVVVCSSDDHLRVINSSGVIETSVDLSSYGNVYSFAIVAENRYAIATATELLLVDNTGAVLRRRSNPYNNVVTSLYGRNGLVYGITQQSIYVFNDLLQTKQSFGINLRNSEYPFGPNTMSIERPTEVGSDYIGGYNLPNFNGSPRIGYVLLSGGSYEISLGSWQKSIYYSPFLRLLRWTDRDAPLGRLSVVLPTISFTIDLPFGGIDANSSQLTFRKFANGHYVAADPYNHRVHIHKSDVSVIRNYGSSLGSQPDQFCYPYGVAVTPTNGFYVADSGNNRIKYYDEQGKLRKIWGTYGDGPGQFDFPQGICVGPDGLVYVADTYNHRIQVFTKDGNYVAQFGTFGSGAGKLNTPMAVSVDESGLVYIADCLNDRVAIFVRAGALPPSTSKSVNPAANAAGWNASNVALTFTATANGSTVKDIRTSVNNGAEVIHNGSTATVNLTTDGIHSVGYYATDTDGHNEVTQYTTVRIDKVKPVTTHAYANGKLTLTASDDRSGISKTYYKLDGAAEVEYSSPVDIPAGNHSVEYRAVDIAGNSETAKLFSSAVGVTSVSIVPTSVTGGTAATGTITLDAPAPAGGAQVSVTSASGAIGLPSSVTVAAGQTNSTFTITTNAVATDTDASITASLNGISATGVLKVTKAALSSFAINPTSVAGGDSSQMTITLSGPAPAGGTSVALSSGNAKATVPAAVVVPAGQSNVTANVLTSAVTTDTSVTLTASLSGVSKTATLHLLSPRSVPSQVTLSPSTVLGGTASTGKVKLAAAAPTGGVVVVIQVGGAGATAPATVTVLAGATEATFSVSTQAVTAQKDVTITATASDVSASGTLTIRPIVPTVLDVTPNSGTGGFTATAKLTISDPAPTGGLVIPVTSNNAAVKVPSAVSIAAGKTSVSFSVTTSKVTSDQTATVSASLNGSAVSATVTAKLAAPADITFAPAAVGGGSTATGTLLLTSPAPAGGLVVSLTSGNAAVKVPASVTVPVGANSATFVATTSPVGQETSVAIMATAAGVSEFGVLVVTPAKPSSIAFLPGSVLGGKPSTATLTLSGVAPVGGLTVQLRSLTPSVVSVPATVVVPAGKNVVTFVAGSTSVLQSAVVTVEATANGYTASGTLTVRPVIVSKVVLTPPTVVGGIASKGAVTLSDPAPTGGVTVTVTSSDPSVTISPASQVVALGKTAAAFTASTVAVGVAKSVTITVTANGVPVSTTLVVTPSAVASVTIAPATVISGNGATGTVKLAKAAAVDTTVSLSVDAPTVASVPASVVVLKGSLTATFAIGTTKQTIQKIVTVSATTGGKPVVGKLTVKP
jgi:hypothetical protein